MTISIGQVSYSLYPPQADPGMLADNEVNHILSFPANEQIFPGRLVQMAADGVSIQQVQGTRSDTTTPPLCVGFALLITAKEGTGNSNVVGSTGGAAFQAGDEVPVLRRGALFAEWKGTSQAAFAWGATQARVYQSDNTAADRGKVTDVAAATTSHSEVGPLPHGIQLKQALTGSGNICLVEVNFPGAV